jgi:hypothetical protein
MKCHRIISVFCIFGMLGLWTSAWPADVKKVEEKTFHFASGGSISLACDEGNITIASWEREEVFMKMTKRAWGRNEKEAERLLEQIEVEIREGDNKLVITELEKTRDNRFNFFDLFDGDFWTDKGWRSGRVDFELTVPANVRLKLQSDEGDVDVTGTAGELTIKVDEGNIEIENVVSENLEITVDEGGVRIGNSKSDGRGFWKINSDEGAVRLEEGIVEELDIHTDEGDIILSDISVKRFWLSADEGDIIADFQPERDGQYRMETDEGDFEIRLPEDAALRVKLQSQEGRIDTEFKIECRRYDDGEICEGVIGETGQGLLRAFTDEGEIYLRKK